MKDRKALLIGISSSIILLLVYFGILTFANSFSHAIDQFSTMWYWILVLVIGFGIQVGLYSHIRTSMRTKIDSVAKGAVTTGGISTGSMIACCLHHFTDVLPIIGLSAAAVFLTDYQVLFILIGILSNMVGMTMMLGIIQRHKLFNVKKGFFKSLFKYDMRVIRDITIFLSIVIFFVALGLTRFKWSGELIPQDRNAGQIDLGTKTNSEGGVTFDITPIDFNYNKPVSFKIDINTHTGALNYDFAKISVLEDDAGDRYAPLEWNGPTGGHHISGILSFPKLKGETKYVKLIIKDVYGVPERVFIWDLK